MGTTFNEPGHRGDDFLQSFNGPFSGTEWCNTGIGASAPNGAEIDDDARLLADHSRNKVANHIGHAFDINVENGIKILSRNP